MKKILLYLLFILSLSSVKLMAQYEGTLGMGAHVDYASEIQRPGLGIDIQYYLTNNVRIAPSLTYYMQINDKRMWNVDGDLHYVIPTSKLFSLYPIAGLHFSEWKNMTSKSNDRVGKAYNKRLGLNGGLGFQYDFQYKARLNFEIKYQSIKDYSQVAFSLGVGFWI